MLALLSRYEKDREGFLRLLQAAKDRVAGQLTGQYLAPGKSGQTPPDYTVAGNADRWYNRRSPAKGGPECQFDLADHPILRAAQGGPGQG